MDKYRKILKERMQKNANEVIDILRSSMWHNRKRTEVVMNKILHGIPRSFWPKAQEEIRFWEGNKNIRYGRWRLALGWHPDRPKYRMADLKHDNWDHTAWVIEHRNKVGVFKDYDIGGS